jgi:exopolysaccharide biosynthesis polyprenyl glycosylphosphotransferase
VITESTRRSRRGERTVVVMVTSASVALATGTLLGQQLEAGLAAALAVGVGVALCSLRAPQRPTRLAVIGRQHAVVALIQELDINGIGAYTTVGWIATDAHTEPEFPRPEALGGIGHLASIVRRHRIDLLLLGSDVPRLTVFDELVTSGKEFSVRVCELTAFYEDLFGHIPVAEINSTWFQYIMHPRFRANPSPSKRVFDLVFATLLGIAVLPLMLVAALLIKLDGGPVLYRQTRIGEKGRPFAMYKLRTMRQSNDDHVQRWCEVSDPRVTRVGRVLRRLHVDELPQLYNVLRGEMSVVGPRPEQPDISERLEVQLAFYSRRHLIRPGLTGWAQVRCGYAGSERGSAWKLSHDLYYLKHQSLAYDVLILARTLAIVVSRRHTGQLRDAPFVTRPLESADHERDSPAMVPSESVAL